MMTAATRRTTRQHRSGNSYSVRIPRDLAYPVADQELEIEIDGDRLILQPKRNKISEMLAKWEAMGWPGIGTALPEPIDVRNPWDRF